MNASLRRFLHQATGFLLVMLGAGLIIGVCVWGSWQLFGKNLPTKEELGGFITATVNRAVEPINNRLTALEKGLDGKQNAIDVERHAKAATALVVKECTEAAKSACTAPAPSTKAPTKKPAVPKVVPPSSGKVDGLPLAGGRIIFLQCDGSHRVELVPEPGSTVVDACRRQVRFVPSPQATVKAVPATPVASASASASAQAVGAGASAEAKASVMPVAPAVPVGKICRLVSDGTARLKAVPASVLPRDTVIAQSKDDGRVPQGTKVIDLAAGEDCATWRARAESLLVAGH